MPVLNNNKKISQRVLDLVNDFLAEKKKQGVIDAYRIVGDTVIFTRNKKNYSIRLHNGLHLWSTSLYFWQEIYPNNQQIEKMVKSIEKS